ncbi:hypothetical protein PIB30_095222, partial [Stylosanthes scabra]|nr:hypothetical protein [Stylosanthes scabra]
GVSSSLSWFGAQNFTPLASMCCQPFLAWRPKFPCFALAGVFISCLAAMCWCVCLDDVILGALGDWGSSAALGRSVGQVCTCGYSPQVIKAWFSLHMELGAGSSSLLCLGGNFFHIHWDALGGLR